jgi:hypothetical protein
MRSLVPVFHRKGDVLQERRGEEEKGREERR